MTKAFDRLGASIQQWACEQRPHRSGRSASPGQSVSYAIQAEQARELRAIRQDLRRLGKEIGAGVREGVNANLERGLQTQRSLNASEAHREDRRLSGGARIARSLYRDPY